MSVSSITDIVGRAREAGFDGIRHEDLRLPVRHDSVEAYLAYRMACGRPAWMSEGTLPAVLEAITLEAQGYTGDEGRVVLDWTVTVLEATASVAQDPLDPRQALVTV